MTNDKKSTVQSKKLREFKAQTLTATDLQKVAGGFSDDYMLECTCGTVNQCHVDGTID